MYSLEFYTRDGQKGTAYLMRGFYLAWAEGPDGTRLTHIGNGYGYWRVKVGDEQTELH